jgi:FkbM family methyltransferase
MKKGTPMHIRLMKAAMRLLGFGINHGNPLALAWHRWTGSRRTVVVRDRESGVSCECNPDARRMFGEVWHDRDYDVPRLPLRPGDAVIDIGANQGFFTCYAAWKGARVLAFEPAPGNFRLLEANVRRNGFGALATLKPWAVGPEAGAVELMISDALGGGMNTVSPAFARNAGLEVRERVKVPCVTLDAEIGRLGMGRIRLCKLDCEGAELDILRSLSPAARGSVDAFVVEFHPEAYPLGSLVDLLLGWGTHQVSFADPKWCERQILRAVSVAALREGATA